MSGPCSEDFRRLAAGLGGISCDADPVVTFRAPWALTGWTLPVVELLVVAGAGLALAHAVGRLRRGQPAWLGLWVASVVYVLVIEPPLYFPAQFGLEERVGLVFAHNVFTVDFLWDRLPLYIVALYPAGIYLAHALVDRLGVFTRRGILVGAVTAGVAHHAFYEIFDQLGPQLQWWAWNDRAPSNDLMFADVPLTSMVLFATTSPAVLVGLARWLMFPDGDRSRGAWVGRTAVVGLATVALQPVAGLPAALGAVALWAVVAAMAVIAVWAVATAGSVPEDQPSGIDRYPPLYALAWLAVFAVLWITARPGVTAGALYALGGAVAVAGLVARAAASSSTRR
jgi:hypothetical protein